MTAPRKGPARAPRSSRSASHARDADASAFTPILAELVARSPGAFGAALVDPEGECVDYAGRHGAFDLRIAAAHWEIVMRELRRTFHAVRSRADLGTAQTLLVRAQRRSFVVHALPDGYVLLLLLSRRAGFQAPARAFAVCERALASEAGWRAPASPAWFVLDVTASDEGRPTALRDSAGEHPLEIVGRLALPSLGARERGWRVRLENGAELTLVCEPGNHWYGDEPRDSVLPPPPRA
jgi:hypothetical protein